MSEMNEWIYVTELTNIPLREGRSVQVRGQTIALFNLGHRVLALENQCPHRGGPLSDGILTGSMVVCPLHSWKISLDDGRVLQTGEARHCVRTFPIRVEAGAIYMALPAVPSELIAIRENCRGADASHAIAS
jgi:nitrite reductase (NADH) small subunit